MVVNKMVVLYTHVCALHGKRPTFFYAFTTMKHVLISRTISRTI